MKNHKQQGKKSYLRHLVDNLLCVPLLQVMVIIHLIHAFFPYQHPENNIFNRVYRWLNER